MNEGESVDHFGRFDYMSTSSISLDQAPRKKNRDVTADITEKIKNGTYKLKPHPPGRSTVWDTFALVLDENGHSLDYAACINCLHPLSFRGRRSGTTTLKRHKCKTRTGTVRENITLKYDPESVPIPVVPRPPPRAHENRRALILDSCVNLITKDILPCDIVKGQGFQEFVQHILDIPHKPSEALSANSLLPDVTSLRLAINDRAQGIWEMARWGIYNALSSRKISYTSDVWTDQCQQVQYATVTAYWITPEWELSSHMVGTEETDHTYGTGRVTCSVYGTLEGHVISQDAVIKDSGKGSMLEQVLHSDKKIDCALHILNEVLQDTFSCQADSVEKVSDLLTAVKHFLAYFNKSGLSNLLPKGLKTPPGPRWTTGCDMLESLLDMYGEVEFVLQQCAPTELHLLTSINKDLLEELATFLKMFKVAAMELSCRTEPTLHLVLPWIRRLTMHCDPNKNDSPMLQAIKDQCQQNIELLYKPHILHQVAVFFNPKQRGMKVLPENQRKETLAYIQELVKQIPSPEQPDDEHNPPPAKKSHISFEEFEDEVDNTLDTSDEIALYQSMPTRSIDQGILFWWKKHQSQYPKLSVLARDVLSIMASSTCSDHKLAARKAGLQSCVNDILLINSTISTAT